MSAVSSGLDTFLRGIGQYQANQAKQTELAQTATAEKNRKAYQDAQIAAEEERIKNEAALNKAQIEHSQGYLDLAKKAANLKTLQDIQSLGSGYTQTGAVPPGATAAPAIAAGGSTTPNATPMNPAAAQFQNLTFRGIGNNNEDISTMVPTPQTAAGMQASIADTLNRPKLAEFTAEKGVEAQKELQKQREDAKNRMAEIQENRNMIMDEARMNNDARMAQARMEQAGRLEIARLNITGGLSAEGGPSGFPVQGILNDVIHGNLSQEQVKKMYPKQATAIFGTVEKMGGQALTQPEQDQLKDFEDIASALPKIAEMNKIRSDNKFNALIPGTDAYKAYEADSKELEGKIPAISRIISGVKRFNGQEMKNYIDNIVPGRNPLTTSSSQNTKIFNNFVQDILQDGFNKTLSRVPASQRDLMRGDLINKYPYVSAAMNAPGSQPPINPGIGQQPGQPGQPPSGPLVHYVDGSQHFMIPSNREMAFKATHPTALKVGQQ